MISSIHDWRTNAELIEALTKLNYIQPDDLILDATYGKGNWWKNYKPNRLVTLDIETPAQIKGDFTKLPFQNSTFDVVCYDPPYKLNGTPWKKFDDPYGVGESTPWKQRMELIQRGLKETSRITRRHLILKCQDQVHSGKNRWQTFESYATMQKQGFRLQDLLMMQGGRKQPGNRKQRHSRREYSTLMVFIKEGEPNGTTN